MKDGVIKRLIKYIGKDKRTMVVVILSSII